MEVAMKKPLWKPTERHTKNANMTRFMAHVNKKYGKKFETYKDLYPWSIDNISRFLCRHVGV
jgi:acetoacetyl-CoA synthetase